MHNYPILLDIHNFHILVVGAGAVGMRKIQGLLHAGPPAKLTVVDPVLPETLHALAGRFPCLALHERPFADTDIHGAHLVFACTPHPEVTARIATICRSHGILCNCAQNPELGSFALPATVRRGDFLLCVATGGGSPALARWVRQDLEARFGPEYGALTCLLAKLRPMILSHEDSTDPRALFRSLVASSLLEALRRKNTQHCAAILRAHLPAALHPHIEEWCHACLDLV